LQGFKACPFLGGKQFGIAPFPVGGHCGGKP